MFGLRSSAYINLNWTNWEYYERIKEIIFFNMGPGEWDAG